MPTQIFYPLAASLKQATARQAAYANSVVHLFTSALPSPTPSTVLSTYTAAEADYDGYAAKTITAWLAPGLAPGSGYLINSPLQQFDSVPDDPPELDSVQGIYLLDSDGDLAMTVVFESVIPMGEAGQILAFYLTDYLPTG